MKKYLPEGYLFETAENKEALKNFSSLENAFKEQRILEAKATMCDSLHNLIVDLNGIKGIIPKITFLIWKSWEFRVCKEPHKKWAGTSCHFPFGKIIFYFENLWFT